MLSVVLGLHNVLRWLVILTGVVALLRCYRGLFTGGAWSQRERVSLSAYANIIGLQFVLGLLLYFWLSPIPRMAWSDMGAAMGNPEVRFYAVEHTISMILAVALAHVAKARANKAANDRARFRQTAILLTLSLLLVFGMIPWDRPLFPRF